MSQKRAKLNRKEQRTSQFPLGPQGQKVVNAIHVLYYDDKSVNVLSIPKKYGLAMAIMEAALRVVSNQYVEAAMNDQLEIRGIPPNIDYWVKGSDKESNILVPDKKIIVPGSGPH
jgi:hypothetical protein